MRDRNRNKNKAVNNFKRGKLLIVKVEKVWGEFLIEKILRNFYAPIEFVSSAITYRRIFHLVSMRQGQTGFIFIISKFLD